MCRVEGPRTHQIRAGLKAVHGRDALNHLGLKDGLFQDNSFHQGRHFPGTVSTSSPGTPQPLDLPLDLRLPLL
jgi:hypothetical protein